MTLLCPPCSPAGRPLHYSGRIGGPIGSASACRYGPRAVSCRCTYQCRVHFSSQSHRGGPCCISSLSSTGQASGKLLQTRTDRVQQAAARIPEALIWREVLRRRGAACAAARQVVPVPETADERIVLLERLQRVRYRPCRQARFKHQSLLLELSAVN